GTPPAFILSQDQTLHKSVCLAKINVDVLYFVQFSKNYVSLISDFHNISFVNLNVKHFFVFHFSHSLIGDEDKFTILITLQSTPF
ncbi:hypothetical protein P6P90_12810, partial [Ectobacillus antri]